MLLGAGCNEKFEEKSGANETGETNESVIYSFASL